MRHDDLRDLLRTAREHLERLEELVDTPSGPRPRGIAARGRIIAQADLRYPRGGGGNRQGKGGHSDPVAATAADEQRQRESRKIMELVDTLDDDVKVAGFKLEHALKIATAAMQTLPVAKGEPGCSSCERVTVDGRPHPESFQRVKADGLCSWCYQFVNGAGKDRPGYGMLPVAELVRWHLDHLGSEVRLTHVRDLMPDAFRAREQRKRKPTLCHHPTYLNGVEGTCARPFMHDGQCLPADALAEAEATTVTA